ncbi:MAG TPA: hypothetical protein VHL11_13365 [Phototrophicaceae bacterium]|jgi:hypothetical protein|nr:hypothetical protein [Phototrophicaceae bacterium]
MKLKCPNCDISIPRSSVNIEKTVAVCPSCGEAFNFADMIPRRKAHPDQYISPDPTPRQRKIRQPEGLNISETPDQLTIDYRPAPRLRKQLNAGEIILMLIMLYLLIQVGALVGMLMASLIMSMHSYLPLVIALGLITAGLIGRRYINTRLKRQWVIVSHDQLKLEMRPLTLLNRKTFPTSSIVSITSQINPQAPGGRNNQRRYDVDVRLKNGEEQVLLSNLNADYAAFIAQELDSYFNRVEDDQEVVEEARALWNDEVSQPTPSSEALQSPEYQNNGRALARLKK